MVNINPILEENATEDVKKNYLQIKTALNLPTVPIFFTYLGSFPDYLDYITRQLVRNLNHPQFETLCLDTEKTILQLIQTNLDTPEEISNWLRHYSSSPAYYNFRTQLEHILLMNIKLAFVFIALREAVKGWAVAAKKLPETNKYTKQKTDKNNNTEPENNDFIFELSEINQSNIPLPLNGIVKQAPRGIEKDLLPEYLALCRNEFYLNMKKNSFWVMRVGFEKLFLDSLDLFPNLIFSPINVVLRLVEKYKNFPDLLYLVTEHFPTYAMHRMIFSGYMLK